jgi:tRNA A37 threonylcarbamoyladenosine biosynthesis protein TsaE
VLERGPFVFASPNSLAKRLGSVISKRAGVALGVWGELGVGKTFTVQGVLRELPCRNISLHTMV